jgi:hypothetical protein
MASWRASGSMSAAVALGVAAACSSFDRATDDPPPDAGGAVGDASMTDATSGDAGPSRIYVYGGYSDIAGQQTVDEAWSAEILPAGALGTWVRVPQLDTSRFSAANVVTSAGRIAFAAGHRKVGDASVMNDPQTDTVATASLAPLTKMAAGAQLPRGFAYAAGAASGPWLYVGGGQVGPTSLLAELYVTSFDIGALVAWRTVGVLPERLSAHALVSIGDALYLAGGAVVRDGSLEPTAETWRTRIGSDGSIDPSWVAMGPLPKPVSHHQLVAARGRLYAIGGYHLQKELTADVSVGTPNPGGAEDWSPATPLPTATVNACAVVANDTIYVTGGYESGPHTKVYAGLVGPNGGVTWSEAAALPGPRAGHGCAAF